MRRRTRREVHPRAGHPAVARGKARGHGHGRRSSGARRSRGAGARRAHRCSDPWRHEPRCLESPRSLPSERERGGRSLGAGARRASRGPDPWRHEPRCLEPARSLPSERAGWRDGGLGACTQPRPRTRTRSASRACQDLGGPWQRVTSRGLPSPRRGPPPSAAHLWELSRACAFATSAERVSPTYWRSAAGEARQSATTSWTAEVVPRLDFAATGRPAPRGAVARRERGGPRRRGRRSGSARAGVRAPLCRGREHRAPLALSR
jgi:hypothetical protein